VTGNTTMRIDAGLDTGDILQHQEIGIGEHETAETLAPRLAAAGASLLVETLKGLLAGTVFPRPQDNSKASLAPILKKEDGRIDFRRTAQEICNRLRGFQPWPGAFTSFRGKNLHVWNAKAINHSFADQPPTLGEIVVEAGSLLVGCGDGTTLALVEVQLEGKKRMAGSDFIHGYHPEGERLGS
jgi:methionyl-tRNA formyltransferase